MSRALRIAVAIGLLLVVSIATAGDQADASTEDYTPVFGKGEHSGWDDTLGEYRDTHGYSAVPTDYGWFTAIWTRADYSTLTYVCYYTEKTDTAQMGVRFSLNNYMPFSDDEVPLAFTIGENETVTPTFHRRENDKSVVELTVSGLDKTRASTTATIKTGPFTFGHDIDGLFDVPVASNLVWCDDREID